MKKTNKILIISLILSFFVAVPFVFAARNGGQEILGEELKMQGNINGVIKASEDLISDNMEDYPVIINNRENIISEPAKHRSGVNSVLESDGEVEPINKEGDVNVVRTSTALPVMNNIRKGEEFEALRDRLELRKEKVSEAFEEIVEISDRNQGIGEQVREIAREQNQSQETIKEKMLEIKQRSKIKTFFFGPDYKKINTIKEELKKNEEKIKKIKDVAEIINEGIDAEIVNEKITIIESAKAELEEEIEKEEKGFSVFGWVNRFFSRRSN